MKHIHKLSFLKLGSKEKILKMSCLFCLIMKCTAQHLSTSTKSIIQYKVISNWENSNSQKKWAKTISKSDLTDLSFIIKAREHISIPRDWS